MYNRYIRNDQGTYTRIPEEEPRHTQGGTSPSGQPEHPPSGGGQQPPHWDSAPPPRPDPPPSGENGPDSLSSLLRHLLDQFHLSSVDSGDLLLLAILFFLFREGADEELLVALGLLLLSLPAEPSRPWGRLGLVLLLLLLAVWDRQFRRTEGPLMVESPYNCMLIHESRDRGRPVRILSTDPDYSQSGMYLDDPDELYFDYTRFYALAVLARPQARDILMLGGGGGSVPKWLLSGKSGLDAADLRLTVVELDPGMSAVARRWFFLPGDDPRLRLIHADARTFLNRQREQYDILLVDVFNSCYSIPFHLGTQEAFAAMRRALRPGGVLAMNVIAAVEGEDGRLLRAIHAGLQRHFARVEVFCVTDPGHPGQLQNLMVLAFSDAATAAALRDGPGHSPEMAAMLACRYRPSLPVTEPLRDDFAPVERFALSLLRRP